MSDWDDAAIELAKMASAARDVLIQEVTDERTGIAWFSDGEGREQAEAVLSRLSRLVDEKGWAKVGEGVYLPEEGPGYACGMIVKVHFNRVVQGRLDGLLKEARQERRTEP